MSSKNWNYFFTGFSSSGALFSMSLNFSSSSLAHQTPHPYSVESYLPIRPLIIQNTEHLSGSWFYTLFMLGEEESAKHRNHLNSNFMVDRKSKCTDANFQVALFFVFLQMTKTNINNKENASPLTPWCEYLQNFEIHCKSALTLFRLRFCKAAIFMAWPQRRRENTKEVKDFLNLADFDSLWLATRI